MLMRALWLHLALLSQATALLMQNSRLKVAIFTDLHYGEDENGLWGPEQDRNSTEVMDTIIASEPNVDFVVYLGDQLTGNNIGDNATSYWQRVVRPCLDSGRPWAAVMGNHDDMPLESSGVHAPQSTTPRAELLAYDQTFALSHTQSYFQDSNGGVSNYYILVKDPSNAFRVQAIMWFFDTGGGSVSETVALDTIEWFESTDQEIKESLNQEYPPVGLAFFHIPTQEYADALNSNECWGSLFDDDISPTPNNTGLISSLESHNISWTFSGHNHGNDWCCKYNAMNLCYARHTGHGGYGSWTRGSRIVEIQSGMPPRLYPLVETWVRLENGTLAK